MHIRDMPRDSSIFKVFKHSSGDTNLYRIMYKHSRGYSESLVEISSSTSTIRIENHMGYLRLPGEKIVDLDTDPKTTEIFSKIQESYPELSR